MTSYDNGLIIVHRIEPISSIANNKHNLDLSQKKQKDEKKDQGKEFKELLDQEMNK